MKKVFPIVILLVFLSSSKAGQEINVNSIFNSIDKKNIKELKIGDRLVEIGKLFLGVPYVGGTLEINDSEQCVINLNELDCVTFYEQCFALAQLCKKDNIQDTLSELKDLVIKMRYRDGKIEDYFSRLHYTSDWVHENVSNGNVIDISSSIGGIKIDRELYFMSSNPQWYEQLWQNDEAIAQITEIEKKINSYQRYYIPKNKINTTIESKILSGDIICITTSRPGLDYAHTGIALKEDGKLKFLHASSKKKKVVIDNSLVNYLNSVKGHTGITVLRPLN